MSSSTRPPDQPFDVLLVEPVYVVPLPDGRLRLHVLGQNPDSEAAQLRLVAFEANAQAQQCGYSYQFRKSITESLLEVRPRPSFVLGVREDEKVGRSVVSESRWRTAYMFIDHDLEEVIHEWLRRVNSKSAR